MSEAGSKSTDAKVRAVLPYVELGCALLAGVFWYRESGATPWPLLLLMLMWGLHWLYAGFSLRPSYFDILLGLFVLSAFVGTQTAYAPGPAWSKFWRIVGAWGLYYAVVHQPDLDHLYGVLTAGGLLGVALTVYFFLVNDWDAVPIKVPVLTALGESISASLPALATQRINPNVIGGALAMLLPFYVPLVILARKGTPLRWPGLLKRILPSLWPVAAGMVLLSLLVATSRGAWLATLAGFTLWGIWLKLERRFSYPARLRWLAGGLILGGIAAGLVAYAILAYRLPGAATLANRLTLVKDSLPLARDYVLTGAGLGTFQMNFSIYTLLIHVGYIINSHNVFVDLLVEQGIIGLSLYLGLVVLCIVWGVQALRRTERYHRWIIEAGLVSLVGMLIHGQVEDVFYGSRWVLLFFIPFALVSVGRTLAGVPRFIHPHLTAWAAVILGLLIIGGVAFWRPLLAQGYASLGATQQARLELTHYEYGRTPGFIMDSVRQKEDLGEAMTLFERAIALDSGNATARQRLAGIHLSRGEYDVAFRHLTAAWEAGHRGSVTRMLLGDALVAQGHVNEAAEMIYGLPWAQVRMEGQAWSRYWERDDFMRAAYAWRTVALLDPERAEVALQRARDAEARATQ